MPSNEQNDYFGPPALRVRGTILVIPGRGETPQSYGRFASRLAADAYRVRVLRRPEIDPGDVDGSLRQLADQLGAAVADLASAGPIAQPLVLVGSDSGAAAVGALVAGAAETAAAATGVAVTGAAVTGAAVAGAALRGAVAAGAQREVAWWPQAVVLAGLPGYGAHVVAGWDEELAARTSCPAHRAVLSDDSQVQRGTLDDPLPTALLDAVYGSTVELPHLLLVGDSDEYADRDALARAAKALPQARLSVVRGAHHDVLNDLQHRSVAAEAVTFLEALRDESSLVPIVNVESSTW
ncbi:alpha-beta hydrolase superfamily lysophospholipase [Jatrophihabitans sp. GAS493]|uniref:serine aminopeptidase domain-containing protein n=1 Tax=Jatrophihabitans sp. GAS493 TaxID=1907575 RepID=UPI000BB7D416|nr:alpha/beta hydrolase [Jatrophihabitans sp. GAS493]SOD72579.1 alpha-beta hydrolase superfamily lysophospholipase [Jatrophihabitans sp. GAS493]